MDGGDRFGDLRRGRRPVQDEQELSQSMNQEELEDHIKGESEENVMDHSYPSLPNLQRRQLGSNPFQSEPEMSSEGIDHMNAASHAMEGEALTPFEESPTAHRQADHQGFGFDEDADDVDQSIEFPPLGGPILAGLLSRGRGRSIEGRVPPPDPSTLSNIFQVSSSSARVTLPDRFSIPPPGSHAVYLEALKRKTPGSPTRGRIRTDPLPLWMNAGRRAVRQLKYGDYHGGEEGEDQDTGVGTSTSGTASGEGSRSGSVSVSRFKLEAVSALDSDPGPELDHRELGDMLDDGTLLERMDPTFTDEHEEMDVPVSFDFSNIYPDVEERNPTTIAMEDKMLWRQFERHMDSELAGYQSKNESVR